MRGVLPILVLLSGCARELPIDRLRVSFRVQEPSTGSEAVLDLVRGTLGLRGVRLRPCPVPREVLGWSGLPAGVDERAGLARPRAWTTGFVDPVSMVTGHERVPAGPWCAMEALISGDLVLDLDVVDTDTTVRLRLGLPPVAVPEGTEFGDVEEALISPETPELSAPTVVPLILELGSEDWLAPLDDRIAAGGEVVVEEGDPDHDALVTGLLEDAGLYQDLDYDGEVDEDREGTLVSRVYPLGVRIPQLDADPIAP